MELLYCANQTVEIWRIHLHRNVEIERNALNAVQNAGDATANYKVDAGICERHKHFLNNFPFSASFVRSLILIPLLSFRFEF